MKDETLRLYHQQAVEVWECFCKLHRELYELTCEEYQALLSGEIETLEALVIKKEKVMSYINEWETRRAEMIDSLNKSLPDENRITGVSQLLTLMKGPESQMAIPALKNLNSLLIDIITETQEQNKRNQVFLNKAMLSLRDIRQGFGGKKSYTVYGADGMTRSAGR